jgi:hypothetical protein
VGFFHRHAEHSRRVGVAHSFAHAPGVVFGQGLEPRHRDDVEVEARREEVAEPFAGAIWIEHRVAEHDVVNLENLPGGQVVPLKVGFDEPHQGRVRHVHVEKGQRV